MTAASVMVLDNVIRRPKDEGLILEGMYLYLALANQGRLAILCGEDEERADWFLKTNGLTSHAYLIPEDPAAGSTSWLRRKAQVGFLRQQNFSISLLVEPDPDMAVGLHGIGVPTLLYIHPQFSQPSFRPDFKSVATPWARLTEEIAYQRKLKASQPIPEVE